MHQNSSVQVKKKTCIFIYNVEHKHYFHYSCKSKKNYKIYTWLNTVYLSLAFFEELVYGVVIWRSTKPPLNMLHLFFTQQRPVFVQRCHLMERQKICFWILLLIEWLCASKYLLMALYIHTHICVYIAKGITLQIRTWLWLVFGIWLVVNYVKLASSFSAIWNWDLI